MVKVENAFSTSSINQKLSVINLLIGVTGCDSAQNSDELNCINKYVKILNVTSGQCMQRLQQFGMQGVIDDLKGLTSYQKEILFRICLEAAYVDEDANRTEQFFMEQNLMNIGLSVAEQKQILRNVAATGDFL